MRPAALPGLIALGVIVCGVALASEPPPPPHSEIPFQSLYFTSGFYEFLDPDPYVLTKEFAFFSNTVPDTGVDRRLRRDLFHLVYQRTAGPQAAETMFGHAWSRDLFHWVVDTAAFVVDTTRWNSAHVWAPSLVDYQGKVYMFYAGVDPTGDQSIGYASTSLLDTTNTVWDPVRVRVWTAGDTRWAVKDPPLYGSQTQFRDPFVIPDPDSTGRLLMFYAAHDSVDALLGRGGLAVGVARSRPGTVNGWNDLGYYPSTLRSVTKVAQLEGPHVFPVNGGRNGWRLMYSNAGSPPGETGSTTIRFEQLAPGASVADTTPAHWSAPQVLRDYLGGSTVVFGWSGSEQLHVNGADYLAGFTAWGPVFQGIAITRMAWQGNDFTLGLPVVSGVDEVHSPARGVSMSLPGFSPHAGRVTFVLDSPLALDAKLEIFDAQGRRIASPLAGRLSPGRTSLAWDVAHQAVPSGVYFARLSFAGGTRSAVLPITR